MGCRVGNRSSHRRSFRARNEPPGWENTDRPVMRSTLCNIPAASSGRRGGCGRPVTNHFEGTGVVLWTQLTRRNLYHRVGSSKSRFLNSISSVRFYSRFSYSDNPVSRDLARRAPTSMLPWVETVAAECLTIELKSWVLCARLGDAFSSEIAPKGDEA